MKRKNKERCERKYDGALVEDDDYAQSEIEHAIDLLIDYANTDEAERDPDELISELNYIEEMLDEESDVFGWNGYWQAMEAISFFANQLGVAWASPYSYCVVRDDDATDSVQHLQVFDDDVEVIRKVAKIRNVLMPDVVREFAISLKKKYAKELAGMKKKERKGAKRSGKRFVANRPSAS